MEDRRTLKDETAQPGQRSFFNQFLLTDQKVPALENWNIINVGKYFLHAHPHLEVATKQDGDYQLIVLGYWYDFRNPSHSNNEIAQHLNIRCPFPELLDQLQFMSGIYLVLWKTKDTLVLLPDLCALREVYVDQSNHESIIAASSPNIISLVRPVKDVTDNAFYSSEVFKKRVVWVDNKTSYQNMIRLKPNHCLDLYTGKVTRFFPNDKLPDNSVEGIVQKVAPVLSGILKAVTMRNERVMVGLTAGWDSRLLLAASKAINSQLTYFVNIYPSSLKHDHIIPGALAKKLNFTFLRLQFSRKEKLKPGIVASIDLPNVLESNIISLIDFQDLFGSYKTISGSVSEISRNEFGLINNPTGAKLAALAKYPGEAFCIETYDAWIKRNQELFTSYRYNLLDMFYWEEILANRVAKSIAEAHAVDRYIFPAFNCRYLITSLLSADTKYRGKQHNILYTELIRSLWKETLLEPVNPSLKKTAIRVMQKIGVYNLYRNIFTTGILPMKK